MAGTAAPATDLGDGWRAAVRRDDAALDDLAAEWAELYARCPGATPFQSSAWLTAWWRHYGRAGALRLAVVRRRDGRLVGLGAFYAARRLGVPALLPLGAGLSDWTDVLADPDHEHRALDGLASALLAEPGWQVLDLPEVRAGAAALRWAARWPGPARRLTGSMCADMPARPFDDVIAAMPNASTRQSTRRSLRRLDAAGLVGDVVPAAAAADGVRLLLALHEQQWRDRGGMTPEHGRPRFARFLADAASAMVAGGQARLTAYRLDGEVVASDLTLVGHDVVGGYLYGARPELFGRFNVTAMLMRTALTTATAAGAGTFSMLRGRETYKSTWQAVEAPNARVLLGRPGRPVLAAYASAVRARSALAAAARERAPAVRAGLLAARDVARNPSLLLRRVTRR
jgi:CelD/BcsL family acetyltransferase involved in cellulose biosynthesis